MTISPGTHFDDPRFRGDERTPAQRMSDGDYYVADDELAASTKRAVRLLSLYEQAHPTDPDIARYLLAQVLGQVGECVDIRPPLRVDYGHNISIGDGSIAVGNPARVIKNLDPTTPRTLEAAGVGVIPHGHTGEQE